MSRFEIIPRRLTAKAFAPFGSVIETDQRESFLINNGMCQRFHELAEVDFDIGAGKAIISIFRSKPYAVPLVLSAMERHPLGSQAFIPLYRTPFLVTVAVDEGGRPSDPQAFLTEGGQGINIARNTWHGVLTPLGHESDFLVVDRAGPGVNLEEVHFRTPFLIEGKVN